MGGVINTFVIHQVFVCYVQQIGSGSVHSAAAAAASLSAPLPFCLMTSMSFFRRLNYINDFDPVSHDFKKPIYRIEPYVTKTGQLDCYKPKGTWDNPTKRNWLKYDVSNT
jgi:hypothetical protein